MGYSTEVIYSSSDQNDDSNQECFGEFYFAFCWICMKCVFYDELMRRLSSSQFGISKKTLISRVQAALYYFLVGKQKYYLPWHFVNSFFFLLVKKFLLVILRSVAVMLNYCLLRYKVVIGDWMDCGLEVSWCQWMIVSWMCWCLMDVQYVYMNVPAQKIAFKSSGIVLCLPRWNTWFFSVELLSVNKFFTFSVSFFCFQLISTGGHTSVWFHILRNETVSFNDSIKFKQIKHLTIECNKNAAFVLVTQAEILKCVILEMYSNADSTLKINNVHAGRLLRLLRLC